MAVTPRLPPYSSLDAQEPDLTQGGQTNFQFSIFLFYRRKQMPLSGLPSHLGRSLLPAAHVGPGTLDAGAHF